MLPPSRKGKEGAAIPDERKGKRLKKLTKTQKKKIITLLVAAYLLVGIVIILTISLFVTFDTVTNRFEAASLEISLLEDHYDRLSPSEKMTLVPNKTLPKDPRIQNIDKTDAFVFLKVTVPVSGVTDVEADGTKPSKLRQEVFRLKTEANKDDNTRETDFNTSASENDEFWIELPEFETGTDLSGDWRTYVFGYSVFLRPGETTETLFDYIQLKNLVQYEISPDDLMNVRVDAYGIQADYVDGFMNEQGVKKIVTPEQLAGFYRHLDSGDV